MTTAADPLTILYVGNFTKPWCTEVHIEAALHSLGHRVVQLQENELDWATVPTRAEAEGAHLLCWTRTWPADLDVVLPQLDRLREMGVPSLSYHLDLFLGLDREHQVKDQPFFHTDLVVTPHDSERWGEFGVNHLWLPPGVHGGECDRVAGNKRRWPWDVVFVGSGSYAPYPHPEWAPVRGAVIDAFKAEFGPRFGSLPRRGQPVRGADLQELYATVPVVLGDSCLAGAPKGYWSDRVPETIGRGGFLIHPIVPGYIDAEGWGLPHPLGFNDAHLAVYESGNPDQAVAIARAALGNDQWRRDTAETGRALVLDRDTYAHRLATALAEVDRQFGFRDISPSRTFASIGEALTAGLTEGMDAATPAVVDTARGAVAAATPHPPMTVSLHGHWSARFDPRPGEVGTVDVSVVNECWTANDYRVPLDGFRGGTVLDIGGNIGAFAVLAAKAGAGKVWTYEPEAENRSRLHHHLDVNGVGHLVEVVPMAVTDGLSAFVSMQGTGGGATVIPGDLVPTTTLADIIAKHGPFDFCKIDCEGGEWPIFATATADLLYGNVKRMAIEWHSEGMGDRFARLNDDGGQLDRWKHMVAVLADCGRVEIMGHPSVGGLIHWKRH